MGKTMFDDIRPPQENAAHEEPADVTPTTDHSIRNVSPLETEERESRRAKRAERRRLPGFSSESDSDIPKRQHSFFAMRGFGVWVLAGILLVGALSLVGFVFIGKTTISIVPQQESVTLSPNVVYTAYQHADNGELGYTVVSTSLDATKNVTATGKESVEEKASGKIIIYNNFDTVPQRLITNTRFEAPNGEIYRIRDSVTVPGKRSDGTPGTLEVTVYADRAGSQQNISALGTRFTIPGLAGDPRYDAFHAELSEPITGGFVGQRAIVDENLLAATRTQLRDQLRERVSGALTSEVSEADVLFDGALFVSYESQPVAYAEGDIAQVREVATVKAVVFKENDLARILAAMALATPEDGPIALDNPENLVMNIVNKSDVDIVNDALIQFTLEGKTRLTWLVDTDALKHDLVGKHSGALNTVMSGYPGIKSAQATIRPFWKDEFPSEIERIRIELYTENE